MHILNFPFFFSMNNTKCPTKGLFTNFFSPVRAHLFDAARWIKLRPNRWILSATSKRSYRGVDRTGKGGSFTRESLIDIINPFSIYAPF